jgi:hypothetical protein
VVQHVVVRRARPLLREQVGDASAGELQGRARVAHREVVVQGAAGVEAERLDDVEARGGLQPLEAGVQREPGLALGIHDRAAVVGVGDVGLGPHAAELHRGHTARSQHGLVGNPGPLEDAERLLGVRGAGDRHRRGRRQLHRAPDEARRDALRPEQRDQQAGRVGVVAALLEVRLQRALHAAVVELRPDRVADPLVDVDRSLEVRRGVPQRLGDGADRVGVQTRGRCGRPIRIGRGQRRRLDLGRPDLQLPRAQRLVAGGLGQAREDLDSLAHAGVVIGSGRDPAPAGGRR